jgi:hypothetical protein
MMCYSAVDMMVIVTCTPVLRLCRASFLSPFDVRPVIIASGYTAWRHLM